MVTQTEIDETKMGEFAQRFLGAINSASVVSLASVGRHTGLFEAMAKLPASTSGQLAAAAGLEERYVREWLGGMVLGQIVEYDPEGKLYTLPPEHAALLTAAAGPSDLSNLATFFPYAGQIEKELVQCFRKGGGVPYSSYPDFQMLQAGFTTPVFDASLINVILPLAPGLVERLQSGIDVLDIGCGAGHAVNLMAHAFPSSRFTGYDFSLDGIDLGREEARAKAITNARFEAKDISKLDEPDRYDLITAFELVHDLADPARVLANVYSSLKPGGIFFVVDIAASSNLEENKDHPIGPTLFFFSVFHCMTVSLAQGGAGLGTLVGEQKTTELLCQAGFSEVEIKHVEGDFFYTYYIARKN